ncbi:hypothetical protein I9054_012125 [Acinetobacter bereziniae]|uniref:Uncharacterized protein n=1 Tax=Acinetobacter bereziniae TaxID=106648 RepID=A0A8I1AG34_ACIBZ|nr:hypothetical protein [Acinetobacter bereziniae]QQC82985.1 hypothetical protein I9190_11705 [Acinetobacter bereziniae]UUN96134.1 hypothetical protein I9054_012125 [Acinetobacter bereziniae]
MNNIALRVFWTNSPMPIQQKVKTPDFVLDVPFGNVLIVDTGTVIAPVQSVNNKTGHVVLNADDVDADQKGSANTVKQLLSQEIQQVKTLAETNQLNLSQKVEIDDFDITQEQVELNRLAILSKADIQALAQLALLVDTKADQSYVKEQIANLVGSAPEELDTIYELVEALQAGSNLLESLNEGVAIRVRFDIATQALTEIQKQNARTNIGAEKLGTAQEIVSRITAQSLGAATAAQGAKADTALQSADVAPVALSGLFSSLTGQNKIFDVIHNAYQIGSNSTIVATDTLGQMLGKLQAQINSGSKVEWVNGRSIGTWFESSTIDSSRSYLEFARINGDIWIRGEIFPISNQTSNQAYIALTDQRYTRLKREPANNGGHYVCTFNAYQAGIAVVLYAWIRKDTDTCTIEIRYLSGSINSVNNGNPSLNITTTCLGKLLNP